MGHVEIDSSVPTLEYQSCESENAGPRSGSGDYPMLSFLCLCVPLLAIMLQNPVLGMLGVTVVAWLGVFLGTVGVVRNRGLPGMQAVSLVGALANGLVSGLPLWVIYTGGLC